MLYLLTMLITPITDMTLGVVLIALFGFIVAMVVSMKRNMLSARSGTLVVMHEPHFEEFDGIGDIPAEFLKDAARPGFMKILTDQAQGKASDDVVPEDICLEKLWTAIQHKFKRDEGRLIHKAFVDGAVEMFDIRDDKTLCEALVAIRRLQHEEDREYVLWYRHNEAGMDE